MVFSVAEIHGRFVTCVSVDAIATFAIVAFAILMGAFSISAAPALEIRLLLKLYHIRTTTTMGLKRRACVQEELAS